MKRGDRGDGVFVEIKKPPIYVLILPLREQQFDSLIFIFFLFFIDLRFTRFLSCICAFRAFFFFFFLKCTGMDQHTMGDGKGGVAVFFLGEVPVVLFMASVESAKASLLPCLHPFQLREYMYSTAGKYLLINEFDYPISGECRTDVV